MSTLFVYLLLLICKLPTYYSQCDIDSACNSDTSKCYECWFCNGSQVYRYCIADKVYLEIKWDESSDVHYWRHSNSTLITNKVLNTSDIQTNSDFTFWLRDSVDPDGQKEYVFESTNYPNYWVYYNQQSFNKLMISDLSGTSINFLNAYFSIIPALNGMEGWVSFKSKTTNSYIRHRDFQLYMDIFEDNPLYRDDASFRIHCVEGSVCTTFIYDTISSDANKSPEIHIPTNSYDYYSEIFSEFSNMYNLMIIALFVMIGLTLINIILSICNGCMLSKRDKKIYKKVSMENEYDQEL